MTSGAPLLIKYRLFANRKTKSNPQKKQLRRPQHRIYSLKSFQTNNHYCVLGQNSTMSKALQDELDHKIQQIKEYGLIAHGYHNENIQYPTHVRRSHDGEKLSRKPVRVSKLVSIDEKSPPPNSTILTPSSHENRAKTKQRKVNSRHICTEESCTILVTPPNKTVSDINPALRHDIVHTNRNASSIDSCLTYSSQPHLTNSLSLTVSDERQLKLLSNSTQPLINQSTRTKTFKQRLFAKFFHHPSKS